MSEKQSVLEEIIKKISPIIEEVIQNSETQAMRESFDKVVYTSKDLMQRYGVSLSTAQKIMREARHFSGGGKIDTRHILWSELANWETVKR